jgi:hypothetical protein
MTPLQSILELPGVRKTVRAIAGAPDGRHVGAVALVDDLGQLDAIQPDALCLITEAAARGVESYQLDMAIRVAATRGAAALVFADGRDEVPLTAATIAEQAALTILRADPGTDLARLLIVVSDQLSGDPDIYLDRMHAVLQELQESDAEDEDELLEAAGAALGAPLEVRSPRDGDISASISADDEAEAAVCTRRAGGYADVAGAVATALVAAALSERRARERRVADAPIRSRGELLSEFLLSPSGPPEASERLLQRMRAADLAVDGWHMALRIELENLDALMQGDELASFHLTERLGRLSLEAAQAAGGVWHRAQLGSALVLIRTARTQPAMAAGREMAQAAEQVVRRIRSRMPEVRVVCGVGDVHVGANGLRATAAEARAALVGARAAGRINTAVSFDEIGLQRTLIEWFSSDTAREAVDLLLRPLDRLGERKADVAIKTLQVYLDNQGSMARTAAELHLHRNAVAYRMKSIIDALDVDLDDPDTRLMLQMACRARSLG